MKGLIHLYCGDGKGKTTAAVGLAVRCAGGGGKVLYASFLKDNRSGERAVLDRLENICLLENPDCVKFLRSMTEKEKSEYRSFCCKTFENIKTMINNEHFDLLVLDEIIAAVNNSLIDEDEVIKLTNNRPDGLEIVMTGRNPSERLIELSDYVTEMKKIKHPYDKGIPARFGIEM